MTLLCKYYLVCRWDPSRKHSKKFCSIKSSN